MNVFKEHPHKWGMTYFEHMVHALKISYNALFAMIASFLHAFFPFMLKRITSELIKSVIISLRKERESKLS